MGHNSVVLGHSKSTRIPQVDELSMGPSDLGRHTMSFEGQHESLPYTLEVNKEEENLSYDEEIASRGNEELEKLQRVGNDAKTLKDLVAKEEN